MTSTIAGKPAGASGSTSPPMPSTPSEFNGGKVRLNKEDEHGKKFVNKYKHIFAIHSEPRTSCLSHDTPVTPSFLGFRNLMVLVLSECCSTPWRN